MSGWLTSSPEFVLLLPPHREPLRPLGEGLDQDCLGHLVHTVLQDSPSRFRAITKSTNTTA